MKVSEIVGGLHSEHVASGHTSSVGLIYKLAILLDWQCTMVYKIGSYTVAFVPMRCKVPRIYISTDYCLGNLYFGSYYLIKPEHITTQNLGSNTVIISDDYSTYEQLPEDLIFYALFL